MASSEGHDAVRLVRRYRTLCEAFGLGRARGVPLAPALRDELADLETRLLDLLGAGSDVNTSSAPAPKASKPVAAVEEAEPNEATAVVFTDGSAEGNPGPGGYCALVRVPGKPDRELSGGARHTTNNQMELTAAIVGLQAAIGDGAREITVITDSEYLVKGMKSWLAGWIKNGWKTASGQPVKNRELWEQLAGLTRGRTVTWQWVRGHAGHPENERCDLLANEAMRVRGPVTALEGGEL